MVDVRVRRAWSSLATATLVAALLSLAGIETTLGGFDGPTLCGQVVNATAPCVVQICPPGLGCRPLNGSCGCVPVGCCGFSGQSNEVGRAGAISACQILTENECGQFSEFVPGGTCTVDGCISPTPTVTPTSTPSSTPTLTATPTNTPRGGNGAECDDPTDCVSGNCVDDVCCDMPCDQPGESCNQPGNEGTCSPLAAPAPATSSTGLVAVTLALIAVAALAMLRRRSTS